jgi:hypothetical protein
MFDIFIPCAQKDYNKLPYVMDAIRRNVNFGGVIHVSIPFEVEKWTYNDVVFHRDMDILKVDKKLWPFRPSWMYQQCLKLFQEVTSDVYLVVDCDTIFNRPVQFFEGEKMIWYTGWAQYNKPYFDFQKKMIDIGKVCPDSFISDTGFYDRNIICEILKKNNYSTASFIERAQFLTTPTCYMCEQDLYASYCYKHHNDRYIFKPLKMGGISAKLQSDEKLMNWTKGEIEAQIAKMKGVDCDTFSMHSWYNESPEQLKAKERIA